MTTYYENAELVRIQRTFYTCGECYRVIPETEVCAATEDRITGIVCSKCMKNKCCVAGCHKSHKSRIECYDREIHYETRCSEHAKMNQCQYDILCSTPTIDGRYCDKHRCQAFSQNGRKCPCEAVPMQKTPRTFCSGIPAFASPKNNALCPVHASRSLRITRSQCNVKT